MTTNWLQYRLPWVLFFLFLVSFSFSQQKFDVVFLRSGGKIIGTIVEKHENQSVVIQLQSGERVTIRWDEITSFDTVSVREKSITEKMNEKSDTGNSIPWKVIVASGRVFHADRLDSISAAYLYISRNDSALQLPIDSLAALVHFKEGHFWIGAGIGLLAGTVVGSIIGGATYHQQTVEPDTASTFTSQFAAGISNTVSGMQKSGAIALGGIIGGIVGFLTGGVISGTDSYTTFDLRSLHTAQVKRVMLLKAIDD